MAIEHVFYGKKIIASIIHLGRIKNKATFFTPHKETLQVGILNKSKGEGVKSHLHKVPPLRRHNIEEICFILQGRARVTFYTKKGECICTKVIKKNDLLIQKEMGHAFEILEATSFLEIKPGPYVYAKKEIKTIK